MRTATDMVNAHAPFFQRCADGKTYYVVIPWSRFFLDSSKANIPQDDITCRYSYEGQTLDVWQKEGHLFREIALGPWCGSDERGVHYHVPRECPDCHKSHCEAPVDDVHSDYCEVCGYAARIRKRAYFVEAANRLFDDPNYGNGSD